MNRHYPSNDNPQPSQLSSAYLETIAGEQGKAQRLELVTGCFSCLKTALPRQLS